MLLRPALIITSLARQCIKYTFLDTKLTEQTLHLLKTQYNQTPTFSLFQPHITTPSDYFRIFQLIQRQKFSLQTYQNLRAVTATLQTQNDNMYLLRAKVCARIADHFAALGRNAEADALYNQGLEIFQQALVPQVLQYYGIYRKYGLFLDSVGDREKAKEVLSESVEILRQYVRMSEDPVTANYHSTEQARACVKLIYLEPNQRQKWLKLANQYWKQCERGVYDHIEYAQTVYENYLDKCKINPKKARLYAQVQLQKIPNPNHHEIITKAFEPQK